MIRFSITSKLSWWRRTVYTPFIADLKPETWSCHIFLIMFLYRLNHEKHCSANSVLMVDISEIWSRVGWNSHSGLEYSLALAYFECRIFSVAVHELHTCSAIKKHNLTLFVDCLNLPKVMHFVVSGTSMFL